MMNFMYAKTFCLFANISFHGLAISLSYGISCVLQQK